MDAISQACGEIKAQLASGKWCEGERLPSLAELANRCGVSRTTMWHALALLKKDSLVHATKGRAIIAGPQGTPRSSIGRSPIFWERLKFRLGRQILSGKFAGRDLPPITKLASQYGVGARTLHKAFGALEKEGIVVHEGYRYRLASSGTSARRPTIVLISIADIKGGIDTDEYRTQQVVDSFERECPKAGYGCRSEGFNPATAKSVIEMAETIKGFKAVAGFIVNIWDPWNETLRNRWLDLLTNLAGRNLPVIVIDQSDSLLFPEVLMRNTRFRVVRVASERAGEMVADFLYRRGHRHIAYITPNINFDWVRARYAGLCRYIKQYGGEPSAVTLFAHNEMMNQYELIADLLDLDKAALAALYHNRLSKDQIQSLYSFLGVKQNAIPARDLVATTMRPVMQVLSDLAVKKNDPRAFALIQAAVLHAASDRVIELFLRPFLVKVSKTSKASAWVCSDDKTALAALSILKGLGKSVPGDISVVGFDNWRDAHEHQLSTYDFNMDGLVQQALIMIADELTLKSTSKFSEVEGYVVERRTTKR